MNTITMLENAQTDPATLERFALDGLRPRAVVTPASADELARVVTDAAKEKSAIVPWGGGTMQHLGARPRKFDLVVQTTRLNRVVEHVPEDLTVTVQAGMTLGEVQKQLATHGQFLPIDVPRADRATIGGILAVGASGPLRLRYGLPRDFTLGIRVVNPEGVLNHFGGKVVKNVAGYEMTKLYIGSMGTLGVITEAAFKVFPLPQAETTVIASFADFADAARAVTALWNLTTPPLAIELLDARLSRLVDAGMVISRANEPLFEVAARFGGTNAVVQAARDKASRAMKENNARAVKARDKNMARFWEWIADLPDTLRAAYSPGAVVRVGVPPALLADAVAKIRGVADNLKIDPHLFSHAAIASIYVGWSGEDAQVIEAIKHLRWALAGASVEAFNQTPLHASVVVESASSAVKSAIDVWGLDGAEVKLMRAIKERFDPNWIFNPGRFVGGL